MSSDRRLAAPSSTTLRSCRKRSSSATPPEQGLAAAAQLRLPSRQPSRRPPTLPRPTNREKRGLPAAAVVVENQESGTRAKRTRSGVRKRAIRRRRNPTERRAKPDRAASDDGDEAWRFRPASLERCLSPESGGRKVKHLKSQISNP